MATTDMDPLQITGPYMRVETKPRIVERTCAIKYVIRQSVSFGVPYHFASLISPNRISPGLVG